MVRQAASSQGPTTRADPRLAAELQKLQTKMLGQQTKWKQEEGRLRLLVEQSEARKGNLAEEILCERNHTHAEYEAAIQKLQADAVAEGRVMAERLRNEQAAAEGPIDE